MADLLQLLTFDVNGDNFKWQGTPDELKTFINSVLGTQEPANDAELCEDKKHNAVTYKTSEISARLYLTTQTLKILGPKQTVLREKFHELIEPNAGNTPAVSTSNSLKKEFKSIHDELTLLRQEVSFIKNHICTSEIREVNLQQEIQISRDENLQLQDELKNTKDALCMAEAEKTSLLTALNIMQRDNEQRTKEKEMENTPIVLDSSQIDHPVPSDPVVNNSTIQSNACATNLASETSANENNGWTKVPKKKDTNSDDILLIGDSMIKNLEPTRMSRRKIRKKVYNGSQLQDIKAKVTNLPAAGVRTAIIHAGTNNISDPNQSPTDIAKQLEDLALSIQNQENNCSIIISGITSRNDNDYDAKVNSTNVEFTKLCKSKNWLFVDNSNVDDSCLNGSGLHLNSKGDSLLASNLIRALRGKTDRSVSHLRHGVHAGRSKNVNKRSNFQEQDAKIMWDFMQLLGKLR